MDHWEETYQRAMDLYSSRLWSKRKAMEAVYVGDRGVEVTMEAQAHRPADVDDWPPSERPEPEDLEAARLLGVEPRPPARVMADDNGSQWAGRWYDEAGTTTAKQMFDSIARMKKIMEKNGAPQPKYIMIHPDQAKFLKEL